MADLKWKIVDFKNGVYIIGLDLPEDAELDAANQEEPKAAPYSGMRRRKLKRKAKTNEERKAML